MIVIEKQVQIIYLSLSTEELKNGFESISQEDKSNFYSYLMDNYYFSGSAARNTGNMLNSYSTIKETAEAIISIPYTAEMFGDTITQYQFITENWTLEKRDDVRLYVKNEICPNRSNYSYPWINDLCSDEYGLVF